MFLGTRFEMIGAIESLADIEWQRRCWVAGDCGAGHDSFCEVTKLVLGDFRLHESVADDIPDFFCDLTEQKMVVDLALALDELLSKHGTDLSDEQFMALPEWVGICQAASKCLMVLKNNNVLYPDKMPMD